ncbi:MAG TPA: hypothetical protein VL463_17590 [Kofleriaceae bacterium]|nr:hypothetical protein [Kofleriaceae bacterium]
MRAALRYNDRVRYAFKLGPLETGEGRAYAYLAVGQDGHVYPATFTHRDADGLEAIASDAGGDELVCEPRLARAGAELGFTPAELPAWARGPRADLAAVIALGPERLAGNRDALRIFFEGATAFWRGKPWRHWTDEDLIEVTLTGGIEATYEAAIMGNARITYGVALYPHRGARERIARGVAREDTLAITFADRPRFAIAALKDAYGLTRLPSPIKIDRGEVVSLANEDLAILGAVMETCAGLGPVTPHETVALEIDERLVELSARVLS